MKSISPKSIRFDNSNNYSNSNDDQSDKDKTEVNGSSELSKYHDEIRRISSFHSDLIRHNSNNNKSKLQLENQRSIMMNKNKSRSKMREAWCKLNRKRRRLSRKINEGFKFWDEIEYSERQNTIGTLDLFKYAKLNEKFAIGFGIFFMWYAASWQPISVFILAIMASLMGQYSKQVGWLQQLNTNTTNTTETMSFLSIGGATVGHNRQQAVGTSNILASSLSPNILHDTSNDDNIHNTLSDSHPYFQPHIPINPSHKSYDSYHFLAPLYSFVTPIFDFSSNEKLDNEENIRAAIHDILNHESNQFLRKSFEINGSAFVLALTQLVSFFIGMILITWAAKKQASRVKILYFKSCLQQEVTWFEGIDSASGSGSSLNALVDKYEDGIGVKLALLSYFIGHIALFSLSALYQMFKLAAFCMPFVLIVGVIIIYLSDWQAIAIGQQALFTKRSLQLAEEILAAIRTVFVFEGQQKELARYSISLQPVYRKSLIKHLYTALNTSLSKFSIFACFSAYCFYAMRLFPPYDEGPSNKATVLAVMRGAEVSIVNILISIPFMEALQQSKGSIARIYAAIERQSRINPSSSLGIKPDSKSWQPTISFRMVQFSYANRSGPTSRRHSTLALLNFPGSHIAQAKLGSIVNSNIIIDSEPNLGRRRQSLIDELTDELDIQCIARDPNVINHRDKNAHHKILVSKVDNKNNNNGRRPSQAIKRMISGEIETDKSIKRILNYFNLDIKAGQSVALVGPSGSGKSTVISLVQRLYDITGGQIFIGQHNIQDLNVAWLRNQIGVVTQEPRLFDLSIADNIRLGLCGEGSFGDTYANNQNSKSNEVNGCDRPTSLLMKIINAINLFKRTNNFEDEFNIKDNIDNGSIDQAGVMQQVIEAAKAAGAHDFITRLPRGYDTRVGTGGVQLSGGQKQRIAIARALIRKPKILLLDESTSALDTESEAQVQEALNEAKVGRTTLIVAHRLSTIKHVDLIVVMYQGQVIECGSHEELMNRESKPETGPAIYKRMYEEQQAMINCKPDRGEENDDDDDGDNGIVISKKKNNKCDHEQMKNNYNQNIDNKKTGDDRKLAELSASDLEKSTNPLSAIEFRECEIDCDDNDDVNEVEVEAEDGDDDDDDSEYEQDNSSSSRRSSSSKSGIKRPNFWELYHFIAMPKWSSLAAIIICLLAGLILPMNLIAHSYLFSAFAYSELDQIGDYLHVFGLIILSFSTFVFIVSFLQVTLTGYVGEKLSIRMRVKTMDSLLNKPMFYFDMDSNSAGALCDRFNSYTSNIQSIAGTRVATMLEAVSTLAAGAFFGFGQNLCLSLFCLSFALLVLVTTIIESRIVQRESNMQQRFDAQSAHLMADVLSNIKTIASLNKETFFINKFKDIIKQREVGTGFCIVSLRTFLTSLKFVMPAMSWSASMYYGCHLLVEGRIDLQTIFIVCPVVLFAVNDTFRALVFLPELLKARKSVERLYRMNQEFSPQVLQTLTFAQQLEQQNRLHLEQLAAASAQSFPIVKFERLNSVDNKHQRFLQNRSRTRSLPQSAFTDYSVVEEDAEPLPTSDSSSPPVAQTRTKKSISFIEPTKENNIQLVSTESEDQNNFCEQEQQQQHYRGNNQTIVNRRMSNINNLPSYMRRNSSRLNSLIPRHQARGKIEFHDVEFAYPNRPTALVLDGFSLNVAPGESVALVGGSGSGKSTCVAILEKLYDYHAGRITLDGYDLRLVDCNWTRSQIGLVSQEPTLLSYTIGDNIRYGDNNRFVSMDEVVEAAKTANIHDFIMSLPDQYDTELSNSADSRSQLSGGQRQRIAIARALIRNASILVFDEATSALDSRNESVVQDALNKARKGKTNLTIAHRLATVKDADKIAVLKDGKVVEVGRHEELIQNPDSHYRKLWERQEGALTTKGDEDGKQVFTMDVDNEEDELIN